MDDLVPGLILLASWLLLAGMFLGFGLTVREAVRGRREQPQDLFAGIWIGIAAVVLLLQLLHFLVPIDWLVQLLTATVGLLLLVRSVDPEFLRESAIAPAKSTRGVVRLAGGMALGLFIAYRALGDPIAFDTGMYHLPAVEWIHAHPVVPGLTNLHGRLGFNNSALLLAGLLDVGPGPLRAWHVTNGFFLFLLTMRAWTTWSSTASSEDGPGRTALYDLFLAPVIVVLSLDPFFASSLTVEVAVAVGVFFTGRWLMSLSDGGDAPGAPGGEGLDALVACLLVLPLLVTFKLSTLAWSATGILVALWSRRRLVVNAPASGRRIVAVGLALGGVLVISWMIRGVVLSGYLAYPSPATAVPVDWRAPLEQAAAEQAWIQQYARFFFVPEAAAYTPRPYSPAWMAAWLSAVWSDATARWLFFYPMTLCVAFGAGAPSVRTLLPGLARSHGTGGRLPGRWALGVLLPALAALVFWFAMAPRPTLGFPFLWVVATLTGTWFFRTVDLPALVARWASAGLLVAPLLVPALLEARIRGENLQDLLSDRVVGSRQAEARLPPEDGTYLTTYVTDSGLELQVPRRDNRCWRAPLPCTPHPSPNLRLREPGDLGSGFVLDGEWAPLRWPNPESTFLEEWRRRSGAP